ncbi:DUF1661 domain-containing protein [Porphyromonas gulae]
MARKFFSSRAKAKKFSSHVFWLDRRRFCGS